MSTDVEWFKRVMREHFSDKPRSGSVLERKVDPALQRAIEEGRREREQAKLNAQASSVENQAEEINSERVSEEVS